MTRKRNDSVDKDGSAMPKRRKLLTAAPTIAAAANQGSAERSLPQAIRVCSQTTYQSY